MFEQIGHLNIAPDTCVINDLNTHIGHILGGLFIGDGAWKTPDRDTVDHNAAGDGIGFVDSDGIAHITQVTRAGQARGASAHDGDLFLFGDRRLLGAMLVFAMIGGRAL